MNTTAEIADSQLQMADDRAPKPYHLPTLEEATFTWDRARAAIAKYPEARQFLDARKKWSKVHSRLQALKELAATVELKERALWAAMRAAEARMPEEAREAL